jgi:hypothetical protein
LDKGFAVEFQDASESAYNQHRESEVIKTHREHAAPYEHPQNQKIKDYKNG